MERKKGWKKKTLAEIIENQKLGSQVCTRCGERKPFDQYSRIGDGSGNLRPYCRKCATAVNREWRDRRRSAKPAAPTAVAPVDTVKSVIIDAILDSLDGVVIKALEKASNINSLRDQIAELTEINARLTHRAEVAESKLRKLRDALGA